MQVKNQEALDFKVGQKSQKVGTESWEPISSSHLANKTNFIKQLDKNSSNEIWLTRVESSHLLNISIRALNKRIKLNKIQHKVVLGNGGRQYRILLQSLPLEIQERYFRELLAAVNKDIGLSAAPSDIAVDSSNIQFTASLSAVSTSQPCRSVASLSAVGGVLKGDVSAEACEPTSPLTASALMPYSSSISTDLLSISAEIYTKSPSFARSFADRWLKIINDINHLRGSLIDEYILNYNLTEEKKISRTRVYEMRKIYNKCGIAGLLPQWGLNTSSNIDEQLYLNFKSAYLKEGSPSVNSCYMQAIGQFILDNNISNFDNLPTSASLKRLLDKRVPVEAQYLARKGEKRYYRKYAPFIERNYSNLKVNEVWVSDHAQLDVAVSYVDDAGVERYGFPWITAFRDMKSGYWVGYEIYIGNPNSDRIFSVIRKSMMVWGLPRAVLFDNGRDYKSTDFGGKRYKISTDDISKKQETTMLATLGVEVFYAAPYNAQTKPIERDFRTIKEQFSKQMVGYRGGNIVERPEVLKDEIKKKKISKISEMKEIFTRYIKEVFHKQANFGKNNNGRSREEVFNTGLDKIRTISPDALALFCMRISKVLTIGRIGVKDSKLNGYYYAEFMAGMRGRKVYMRRDFDSYETAYIFDAETDKLLGVSKYGVFGAEVFAGSKATKDELTAGLKMTKADKKAINTHLSDIQRVSDNNLVVARMAVATKISSNAVAAAEPIYEIMPNGKFQEAINTIKKLENEGVSDLASIKPNIQKKKVYKMFLSEE